MGYLAAGGGPGSCVRARRLKRRQPPASGRGSSSSRWSRGRRRPADRGHQARPRGRGGSAALVGEPAQAGAQADHLLLELAEFLALELRALALLAQLAAELLAQGLDILAL